MRIAGAALLAVMVVHVAVRPESGWILLSGCDVATVIIAVGLVARWHRAVAIAGLFALTIGVPMFAVGVFTTYDVNPTGVAIHVVPPVLAALVIRRHGLPPRAAVIAWCSYVVVFAVGALVAPTHLNVNFAAFVWPPLAGAFSLPVFQLALLVAAAVLLGTGQLAITALQRAARGRSAPPAAS